MPLSPLLPDAGAAHSPREREMERELARRNTVAARVPMCHASSLSLFSLSLPQPPPLPLPTSAYSGLALPPYLSFHSIFPLSLPLRLSLSLPLSSPLIPPLLSLFSVSILLPLNPKP